MEASSSSAAAPSSSSLCTALRIVLALESVAAVGLALWHNSVEGALWMLLVMVAVPLIWLAAFCFLFRLRAVSVAACMVGELLLAGQLILWGYILATQAEKGYVFFLLLPIGVCFQLLFVVLVLLMLSLRRFRSPGEGEEPPSGK